MIRVPLFFDGDNDGDLDILSSGGHFRNNGDQTFENITATSGLSVSAIALTAGDFDRDGWIDVFAVPDNEQPLLFHNNADGSFTDVALEAGLSGGVGLSRSADFYRL